MNRMVLSTFLIVTFNWMFISCIPSANVNKTPIVTSPQGEIPTPTFASTVFLATRSLILSTETTERRGAWRTYTDPNGLYSLQYPSSWKRQLNGVFSGTDGFLRINYLQTMGYYQRVWLVCETLANPPSGPSYALGLSTVQDRPACIMEPLDAQPGSGITLVIQTLSPLSAFKYLLIEADKEHLSQIVENMVFYEPLVEETNQTRVPITRTKIPTSPYLPTLIVEEYPLVSGSSEDWCNLLFRNEPSFEVFQKRKTWRQNAILPKDELETTNGALGPFGYQLFKGKMDGVTQLYDLKRGEQVVLQNITWYTLASGSQSGSDFALMVENRSYCGAYLCRVDHYIIQKERFQSWDSWQYEYRAPLFIADDLYIVRYSFVERQIQVTKNGKEVFSFAVVFGAGPPEYRLWSWDGHWMLSIDSAFIFIDGKSLNRELGIEEIFHLSKLKGELLFFFNDHGNIKIEYGGNLSLDDRGQVLSVQYDDVIRTGCCGCVYLNGGGNEYMVWFYALRDSTWYYVEIGNYEEENPR